MPGFVLKQWYNECPLVQPSPQLERSLLSQGHRLRDVKNWARAPQPEPSSASLQGQTVHSLPACLSGDDGLVWALCAVVHPARVRAGDAGPTSFPVPGSLPCARPGTWWRARDSKGLITALAPPPPAHCPGQTGTRPFWGTELY